MSRLGGGKIALGLIRALGTRLEENSKRHWNLCRCETWEDHWNPSGRRFDVAAPDTVHLSNVTEARVDQSMLILSLIVNLSEHKIISSRWPLADH